jgi:hypothetical protein
MQLSSIETVSITSAIFLNYTANTPLAQASVKGEVPKGSSEARPLTGKPQPVEQSLAVKF